MRTLAVFSIIASIGLLSDGALGLPLPPSSRVIYSYPVYQSDNPVALDLRTSDRIRESQTRLELSLAAFSKAIEMGFVNVVIRPHEHLVSLLRYRKTPDQLPALPVDAKHDLECSTNNLKKRYSSDGSEETTESGSGSFPVDDRRTHGAEEPSAEAVRPPDYRRDTHFGRSSTHAVAGEHLKARSLN